MEYIDGCFEGLFDKNVLLFAHTPMEQGEEKYGAENIDWKMRNKEIA